MSYCEYEEKRQSIGVVTKFLFLNLVLVLAAVVIFSLTAFVNLA